MDIQLYGDMCGGFSLIKDLYKTEIKKLADWRNKNIPNLSSLKEINLIPQNIIFKEPSAELKKTKKTLIPFQNTKYWMKY